MRSFSFGILAFSVFLFLNGCYVPPSPKPNALAPSGDSAETAPDSGAEAETDQDDAIYQTITLSLTTPSGGWSLQPLEAYQLEHENLILWQLTAPNGPSISMISEVSATLRLPGPERDLQHFVLGKTWKWESNPEVTFIEDRAELKDALADATELPFTSVD
ncbi:hypothetical protein [Pelagicoccus sp. SDUM812003]|uniref:hypothetical protein n=1 Tax=Pelagicoccus sp. SDUM812003 TaxID=3041267 RepID=UPI00280F1A19|nr:hypothetical protein [Pelagicoccus sp. SDUM812003]MDQ8203867.1 hypothetical protein [Pelagicoccus sp. SDUM812003]